MSKMINNPDVEKILAEIQHAIDVENRQHNTNILIEQTRHKQKIDDLLLFEKILHNPNYEKKTQEYKAEENSNN